MRSICKLLSHGSSEWAWERKTNGHVVLNRLSGIVAGQSGIAVNLLNSLNADVVNVPWSTCGQKRQGDWGKRWSHDDQEEIKDDGRVKDRRRKQKLFGHRDRKWGEGEKDGEWASEKWRKKRRRWQSALFKLTEILTKLRLMQLPFKLYLGELGVNHYLCTNAPVTQRRFNIGQIKMGKNGWTRTFHCQGVF